MRILAVVLLLALASPAAAQPAGWTEDRQHAAVVERDLLLGFPEGARADLALESYRSPTPGGQIIAWMLEVGVNGDGGGYARTRIDDLRTTVDAMASGGGKVRTLHWSEQADAKQKWVEARLEWSDDEHGILSIARAVWVHPAGSASIREHRVECVLAADAAAALRPACDQAIAAMTITPLAEREAFVAAAAEPPAEEPEPARAEEPHQMRETPSTVGPVLATREPEREEPRDLRPFYVGGFILLIVAVLWWNRKRNAEAIARAERAEAKAAGKPEETAEPLADEPKEDARE
jgi:hypothetical protein